MLRIFSKGFVVGGIAFAAVTSISFVAVSRNNPSSVPIIDSLEKCEHAAQGLLIREATSRNLPRPRLEQTRLLIDGTAVAIYRIPSAGTLHVTTSMSLGRCEGEIANFGHFHFSAAGAAVVEASSATN